MYATAHSLHKHSLMPMKGTRLFPACTFLRQENNIATSYCCWAFLR